MADPYTTLGVARNASEAEIKKAYRTLAKEMHPDRNADNPKAAEKFAAITHAYDLLTDKDKRAQFDRGEIDADGNPTAPFGFGGGRAGGFRSQGPRDQQFAALAGQRRRRRARTSPIGWPCSSSMPRRARRSASPCRTARRST